MGKSVAALTAEAEAFKTGWPFLAIASGTDETVSTGETSTARVAAGWVNTNGVLTSTNKAFSGAAGAAAQRVQYWSASTAGTFGGSQTLTGDATFNAAGAYTVTSITETPSSS